MREGLLGSWLIFSSEEVGRSVLNGVAADLWELHDGHGGDGIAKSVANHRISTGTSLRTVVLGVGLIHVRISPRFSHPARYP